MRQKLSRRRLLLGLLIGAGLAFTAGRSLPAHAAAEHIENFNSDARLTHEGKLEIVETLKVNYEDVSHHGIYRTIPTVTRSRDGSKYYYLLEVGSVDDGAGHAYRVSRSSSGGVETLKIGNPNTTLTGVHNYIIHYALSPVVVSGSAGDRLIMEVTGTDWDWPIDHSRATITLPDGVIATLAVCYDGTVGSTEQACNVSTAVGHITVVRDSPLSPGQGLTYDLGLPLRSVSSYLVAGQRPATTQAQYLRLVLAGMVLVLSLCVFGYMATTWLVDRRARKSQVIIPQYDPPDGLLPAQLGLLRTGTVDKAELTATLLDLAVRGHIKIAQTRPKSIFRSANYTFTKLQSSDRRSSHENILYEAIFSRGDEVELTKLKSSDMGMAVRNFRLQLGNDLKKLGYYTGSPTNNLGIIALTITAIGTGFGLSVASLDVPILSGAVLGGVAGIMIGAVLARYRSRPTGLGSEEWAKVEGFKWFLQVTEADRLKFHDAPAKSPELFSQMLPDAVALGVERQWAKQFEGIDVSQSMGWYSGSGNFNAAIFASTFASDMSSAVGSSFAGPSGSGSVGGGGGGGGGGGW